MTNAERIDRYLTLLMRQQEMREEELTLRLELVRERHERLAQALEQLSK